MLSKTHTHTHTCMHLCYMEWGNPCGSYADFCQPKFAILRNWWVLPALAPAALPGSATSLICSRRHANAVRCQVTQFRPVSTSFSRARAPHRTQTMPFNGVLCVCVCVCVLVGVLWSLPALLLSFPSAHLHLSSWVSFSCCCRVSSSARLMIMLIFAFRNNLLWSGSFHPPPPSLARPRPLLVVHSISTSFLYGA